MNIFCREGKTTRKTGCQGYQTRGLLCAIPYPTRGTRNAEGIVPYNGGSLPQSTLCVASSLVRVSQPRMAGTKNHSYPKNFENKSFSGIIKIATKKT